MALSLLILFEVYTRQNLRFLGLAKSLLLVRIYAFFTFQTLDL